MSGQVLNLCLIKPNSFLPLIEASSSHRIPTRGPGGKITTFIGEKFPEKSCSGVFNCHVLHPVYRLYRGSKRGPPKKVVIFTQQEFLNSVPPNIELRITWIFVIIFALFPDFSCLPDMSENKRTWIIVINLVLFSDFSSLFFVRKKVKEDSHK